MSTDHKITQDLVKIAEDGREGYAKGAAELTESDLPQLAATFTRLSQQRAGFTTELHALASAYGDDVKETGSTAAALHRGWMAFRDAVTGSRSEGVVKTALQGEQHAISVYEKALKEDISPDTQVVVRRQLAEIQAARAEVERLLHTMSHATDPGL
ncbi:MAG: hypothetical protein JWL64_1137 [Frankiales bacterium]|nr:hypothetical protein [Frankiales bacterium]